MIRALTAAALAVLPSGPAFAQSTAAPLSFEVADVKGNKSGGGRGASADFLPGGRVNVTNAAMKELIAGAYSVGEYPVSGGPGWLDAERYDIVAKAAPTTSEDHVRKMLQTLLADRFKLAIHHGHKATSVYALTLGKQAPKLQESAAGTEADCKGLRGHLTRTHMSMPDLAEALPRMSPRYIDLPVVDLTGLKGVYDFKLEWTTMPGPAAAAGRGGDAPATNPDTVPVSIFNAIQDQPGLKIEGRKHPIDIIVIDHVERVPIEN
jgi:uncharacterized protein (TIGR03435 family)